MSEITRELFKEWRSTCGVRRIQEPYERLVADARENGREIVEEMKAKGFKDFHEFSKSCKRYELLCWPSQLGELGSGHVLYFHFLNYLGLVLLLVFILQIPALALYATGTSIGAWHDVGGYPVFFDTRDPCRCVGRNNGNVPGGLPYDPAYGTKCGMWDETPCDSSSSAGLGKWCCMSWCFAGDLCPTAEVDPPYKSNRLYKGLVRSTSSCEAENMLSSAQVQCLAKYTSIAPFAQPGVEDENRFTNIPETWLSPGNTGPSHETNIYVPVLYLVCVFIIIVLTFGAYNYQSLTDRMVDGATTLPNDFAILVRGMPTTATDEHAIKDFFRKYAIGGKETEVVKVVIGWDATEYGQKIREIRALRKQMADLELENPQVNVIKREIARITSDLASAAPDRAARLSSSGIVVVVFRYQSDLRACLDRWDNLWAKLFYRAPMDLSFLPAGNAMCMGEALPRFPMGDFEVARLTVERAPNPGDIQWEEIGVDAWTRRKMLLRTNACMLLLIALCFGITYGLNVAQDAVKKAQKEQESKSGWYGFQVLSFLPAIAVSVLNGVLQFAALKFGQQEYYDTWTDQEFAQATKMTVAMIINTAGVLFVQNVRPDQWYEVGGLINDIFMIILFNSLIPPCFQFFDIGYMLKCRVRWRLTQERLDSMNQAIRQGLQPSATSEEQARLKTVKQEVEYFKRAWTPSEAKSARRYAKALNIFFVCLLYSPVLPWFALIGFLGLFLQYWIDKFMLIRWNKRPARPANCHLCMNATRFVKYFAPVLFSVSWYLFLTPSWQDKEVVRSPFFIALAASGVFFVIPMHIVKFYVNRLMCSCGATSRESLVDEGTNDYYKAQYMWTKEMKYHKDHFLYKNLSEALNPEYLVPGVDSSTGLEDLKKTYEGATAEEAKKVGGPDAPVLKGGRRVEGAIAQDPAALRPWPTGVIPTTIGSEPAMPIVPHVAPAVPTGATHLPGHVAPSTPPDSACWEFGLDNGTFKSFDNDCQAYIERKYIEYKGGGRSYYNVTTSGKRVSVDFEKMTSKVEHSHKIRPIRRLV